MTPKAPSAAPKTTPAPAPGSKPAPKPPVKATPAPAPAPASNQGKKAPAAAAKPVSTTSLPKTEAPKTPTAPAKPTPSNKGTPVGASTPPIKPAKLPKPEAREVRYPEIECFVLTGDKALTREQMEEILGWETEDQYTTRMMQSDPKLKEEQCKFGDNFLLTDLKGNKVRCWNNDQNRPFTEPWARAIAQDFLNRKWAGTSGREGETINGESIIIGTTGLVLSAQHRGIGFILACQMWDGKNKAHWQTIWQEEPRFPTILVRGIDESLSTVSTLDNVRPRSLSDVVSTSGLFKDLDQADRKKADRMMAAATDTLWVRTGMNAAQDTYTKFQTHATSVDFIRNHSKLADCVRHLYEQNADNSISALKLSPGTCAALMYLMGSCSSDPDVYRYVPTAAERNENTLAWDFWDKAKMFFCLLADTKSKKLQELRGARRPNIGDEDSTIYSGRIFAKGDANSTTAEKVAQLCKGWNLWAQDEKQVYDENLRLAYRFAQADDGTIEGFTLTEKVELGGIDEGDASVGKLEEGGEDGEGNAMSTVDPDPEEVQTRKPKKPPVDESPEQERKRRAGIEAAFKPKEGEEQVPLKQKKLADQVAATLAARREMPKPIVTEMLADGTIVPDDEDEDDEATLEEEIASMPPPASLEDEDSELEEEEAEAEEDEGIDDTAPTEEEEAEEEEPVAPPPPPKKEKPIVRKQGR